MATDKSFSLVSSKRPAYAPLDAKAARRTRLLGRLSRQLELLEITKRGELVPRHQRRLAKWWWLENGHYFVSVYYTRQPLELGKGKFAAQCTNLDAVSDALRSFVKPIENGDFDNAIETLANGARAKFKQA